MIQSQVDWIQLTILVGDKHSQYFIFRCNVEVELNTCLWTAPFYIRKPTGYTINDRHLEQMQRGIFIFILFRSHCFVSVHANFGLFYFFLSFYDAISFSKTKDKLGAFDLIT